MIMNKEKRLVDIQTERAGWQNAEAILGWEIKPERREEFDNTVKRKIEELDEEQKRLLGGE